jgi:DegV family protein with EDD domain
MNRVCILTDSSVQFTVPKNVLDNYVFTIPFIRTSNHPSAGSQGSNGHKDGFGLESPTESEIINQLTVLRRDYSEILVITLSSALSGLFSRFEKAIKKHGDVEQIRAIDSHTTSVGLGLLVQKAVDMIAQGANLREIEGRLRVSIPHIYTLFCLPDLSYLAAANFLTPAQAVVGEMLELLPIFSLEDGCLTATQKVRTQRHLLETFQEFVDEYTKPAHVAVIKNGNHLKATLFREYVTNNFPQSTFSEHILGASLTELLGPQSIGLIVMDRQN